MLAKLQELEKNCKPSTNFVNDFQKHAPYLIAEFKSWEEFYEKEGKMIQWVNDYTCDNKYLTLSATFEDRSTTTWCMKINMSDISFVPLVGTKENISEYKDSDDKIKDFFKDRINMCLDQAAKVYNIKQLSESLKNVSFLTNPTEASQKYLSKCCPVPKSQHFWPIEYWQGPIMFSELLEEINSPGSLAKNSDYKEKINLPTEVYCWKYTTKQELNKEREEENEEGDIPEHIYDELWIDTLFIKVDVELDVVWNYLLSLVPEKMIKLIHYLNDA